MINSASSSPLPIFDEKGKPCAALSQILQLLGRQMASDGENNLTAINTWAQNNLLRQGERWEEQRDQFENLKPLLLPLLTDLGFVNATSAPFKKYVGAIIHGDFLPRVRRRLQTLLEQWQEGVRFQHLYFFSGARPLEESEKAAIRDWSRREKLPTTANEMVKIVWEQSEISEDMRQQVEVHFVSAPLKKDPRSAKLLRPTTDDTIYVWLQTDPPPGRYLAISNAPYTRRQDAVIRTLAPSPYQFDTIGSAADPQEKMAIFLDELARLIFQIAQSS